MLQAPANRQIGYIRGRIESLNQAKKSTSLSPQAFALHAKDKILALVQINLRFIRLAVLQQSLAQKIICVRVIGIDF
jgi:hypothetical protein